MEIKKIVEGMTAPQVAGVIDDNFKEADNVKADKTALMALSSTVSANKSATDEAISALSGVVSENKTETDAKLSELGSKVGINRKQILSKQITFNHTTGNVITSQSQWKGCEFVVSSGIYMLRCSSFLGSNFRVGIWADKEKVEYVQGFNVNNGHILLQTPSDKKEYYIIASIECEANNTVSMDVFNIGEPDNCDRIIKIEELIEEASPTQMQNITTNQNDGNVILQDGWTSIGVFLESNKSYYAKGNTGYSLRYSLYEDGDFSKFIKGGFSDGHNNLKIIVPDGYGICYAIISQNVAGADIKYGKGYAKEEDIENNKKYFEGKLSNINIEEAPLIDFDGIEKIETEYEVGVLSSSGEITHIEGYSVSSFIELGNYRILLKTPKFGNANYCYYVIYDENKLPIYSVNCVDNNIVYNDYNCIALPYNAKFIRYCLIDTFKNEHYGLFYSNRVIGTQLAIYNNVIASLKSGHFDATYISGVTTNMNNGNYITQDGWTSVVFWVLGGEVYDVVGIEGYSIRYSLYDTISKRYDSANLSSSVFVKGSYSSNNKITIDLQQQPINRIYTIVVSQQMNNAVFDIYGGLTKKINDLSKVDSIKEVLWLGTSIPEGGSNYGNSYPQQCAKKLGFNVYNNARGSSYIHSSKNGVPQSGAIYNALGLVDTIAEKEYQLSQAEALTDFEYNRVRTSSYEYLLLPYINGEIASCTTIVFDHGYNDSSLCKEIYDNGIENIDWSSRDKNTFIGAFNFLYDEIMKVNPNIRIVIAGFLENEGYWQSREDGHIGNRYTKAVCAVQQAIAEHYGFPLLKIWEKTNFTFNYHIPNTTSYLDGYGKSYTNMYPDDNNNVCMFQYFCPDSVHPHSSQNTDNPNEAKGLDWLSSIYTSELRDLIH